MRKHLEGFAEIHTAATSTKAAAERILTRVRIIQEGLSGQLHAIVDEVAKVKEDSANNEM